MPIKVELDNNYIVLEYSTMLLVIRPKYALLEITSWPEGEYMTHAIEEMF